jgi:hypothetical protein
MARLAKYLDTSTVDVRLAHFDDFMTDAALAEVTDRVDERASAQADAHVNARSVRRVELELFGVRHPPFPEHDHRSAQRQAVPLGAGVGAAGPSGPLRPITMIISNVAVDDQFDRPWAAETMSAVPDMKVDVTAQIFKRLTRHLRPQKRTLTHLSTNLKPTVGRRG